MTTDALTTNYLADGSAQTFLGGASDATSLTAYSSADTSSMRLLTAGLTPGGGGLLGEIAGRVLDINFSTATGDPIDPELDWRVRLSVAPSLANSIFYGYSGNTIMRPLNSTKGVVFPYTPTINTSHTAKYGSQPLTHSNYSSYFYEYSEVGQIRITGDFTCQNIAEGQYLFATIMFLRACTKMFFGGSLNAGSPPPLMFLDGYGPYFPHVPCVLTQFDHNLPKEVDYIPVPIGVSYASTVSDSANSIDFSDLIGSLSDAAIGSTSYGALVNLPTHSEITVTLQPVYSRRNVADNFTLEKYAQGALIENGTSPYGGFY